jgi:hypothetical protein
MMALSWNEVCRARSLVADCGSGGARVTFGRREDGDAPPAVRNAAGWVLLRVGGGALALVGRRRRMRALRVARGRLLRTGPGRGVHLRASREGSGGKRSARSGGRRSVLLHRRLRCTAASAVSHGAVAKWRKRGLALRDKREAQCAMKGKERAAKLHRHVHMCPWARNTPAPAAWQGTGTAAPAPSPAAAAES